MAIEPGKPEIPTSDPARLVGLLLLMDAVLLALIVEIVFATAFWSPIFMAIAFILFLVLTTVLIYLIRQRGREIVVSLARALWLTVSAIFWAVAAGAILLGIGYGTVFVAPSAGPFLLYALIFLSILMMVWSGAKSAIRCRRMFLILNNLESAVRLGLPFSRTVFDAAQSETGIMRKRLLALHNHLDRGESLDQALIHAVPEVPCRLVRAIAAGQRMGCLDHVLDEILRRRSDETAVNSRSPSFYWAYPAIMVAVISLIFIVVIPKFESIFRDFHIELPPITSAMVRVADDSGIFWLILVVLALIPLGQTLAGLFPSFRRISPFGGIVTDQIVWWTPFIGGFVSDRGMAELCDLVAAAVRTGYPLDESLREAAAAQPNAVMRYRASAWARAVNDGQTMHEAARHARMPELFASMLATVRGGESLQQVLGFLWRYYEYRVGRTRAVLQAMVVPAIVLSLGAIVGIIGISLLQPMAMLTTHIAGEIYGGGF